MSMTPGQLRKLADDIEKGNARADYHIEVHSESERPMYGEIYDPYSGHRFTSRQWTESKIVIEVTCYSDVQIQSPVDGSWMTLRSTR